MKTGYSILSEYINSNALEYVDCESFQIVCPSCYEPLFKVNRTGKSPNEKIQYLSHYKKSEEYELGCELRAVSSSKQESHNQESRSQKLQYFLKVFRIALSRDPLTKYSISLNKSHKLINKSKGLSFFRQKHFESALAGGAFSKTKDFEEFANSYIDDIGGPQNMPITGFSLTTQIKIASDLCKLISTEKEKQNYDALFNHSSAIVIKKFHEMSLQSTNKKEKDIFFNISSFISDLIKYRNETEGMNIIAEMSNTPIYPPYVEQPSSYLLKVASEIGHEMIGTLIRLPYFSLLADFNERNKQKKHNDR